MKILYFVLCAVYTALSYSEVLMVDPIEKGFLYSSDRTATFLWESKNAKVTLLFIPGGEGQIHLNPDKKDLGGFYGATLKPLSDSNLTSGNFNVVVFDSPKMLPTSATYPGSRATADHLMRIESVVRYYTEKFHFPVWLMGHSNGAVSVTEFYKYLQKYKRENLIAGVIYSSGRTGATFNSQTDLPILFLAHQQDGCAKSEPYASKVLFSELKKTNPQKMEYTLIMGGESQSEDVCRSGYHMFYKASAEVYNAIDGFVTPLLR